MDDWTARTPHPALRHLVRWYMGYEQDDVTLAVHRGLPSRSVTLIVSLADPVRMRHGPCLQALVGGLHLAPALIEQDRHQRGLHVELNPVGLRALLGVPATELASDVVDLAELPVPWARTLVDQVAERDTWADRFDVLDTVLASALRPVDPPDEVRWAWRRMVADRGGRPVAELASEVGWSRRHFSERFAGEVGLGPKQVSRLIRFEHSGQLLRAGRPLAEVAADAGYYDQAHLSNEWRALAGCSPGEWLREEFPFLQDTRRPDEPE
ncbi:AraC family transcriptional regulator [Kibdelosporangium lantanae]